MTARKTILIVLGSCFIIPVFAFAQQTEKVLQSERQIEEEKLLRERIEEEQHAPVIEETPPEVPLPAAGEQKAFVKKINVANATLLSEDEINEITAPFENRELSLTEMQQVVDRITDAYRSKGYVTSRGYLPPQKIVDGILQITAVEGTTGDIEVKGNRFFRSAVISRAIRLEKGEPFNYADLRKSLSRLNSHPDRTVKAVLVPGKEPGATDIILEVTDRLPMHARIGWDNYGSRYIRKDRYSMVLSHNNLFGYDDIFSLNCQLADAQDYQMISGRYLFPVSEKTNVGGFATVSKVELGKEYRALQARGKSRMYGIFATQELVNKDDILITGNAGFDYLDSFNFQAGTEQSRDRMRVVKLGFDMDTSDSWAGGGRTIISPESDFGLSDILGGLQSKDDHASRTGAGGKFIKHNLNVLRLQKLPFETSLLWKNNLQVSPYVLAASQQFQLGGISNVRGYPNSEVVGDQGLSTTFEWIVPPYLVPKDIQVPWSKAKLYDALRFTAFFDIGQSRLHNPQAGEEKRTTLRGYGLGLRFNLPEDFSLRVDLAWPLGGRTPSDGDRFHPWLEFSKQF